MHLGGSSYLGGKVGLHHQTGLVLLVVTSKKNLEYTYHIHMYQKKYLGYDFLPCTF